jgi:hypothetical protein
MADADPPPQMSPDECREPTLEDIANLSRALNAAGARYLIVGGFAIRAAGFLRKTMDVDLLVEAGADNEARVIEALMTLPDQAVREIKPGDLEELTVIRVADEILVDLMKSSCGVLFQEAIADADFHNVNGVRIPFASPKMLWKMKQTYRDKDIPDRMFLKKLLAAQGIQVEEAPRTIPGEGLRGWLKRVFGSGTDDAGRG